MPKKIKNCFYSKLTFENLLSAHKRSRKNKPYKSEVILFELNLENNLINLLNQIRNHTYHLGNYFEFTIYEPKERKIKALPYRDRIVHQWYVEEFIKPYIVPKFISTSYACLTDKGTHKAANKIQEYMRIMQRNKGDFWILKCDIEKFFYNINPNILYNILKKYISDNDLLNFSKLLIFDSRNAADSVGIPIGNYTSQYFANIYLNELDQFIKRKLHIKYYVRYMDDFILLLDTKENCITIKKIISDFLWKNLKLHLNKKSRYYPSKMGADFCGYRIFTTHRLLRKSSKTKIKNQVKKWNKLYSSNKLDVTKTIQSINSWIGHSMHCNSYHLQQKILNTCNFLYTNSSFNQIEKNFLYDIEHFNDL